MCVLKSAIWMPSKKGSEYFLELVFLRVALSVMIPGSDLGRSVLLRAIPIVLCPFVLIDEGAVGITDFLEDILGS